MECEALEKISFTLSLMGYILSIGVLSVLLMGWGIIRAITESKTDLIKFIQVALGPLSGIAARTTKPYK